MKRLVYILLFLLSGIYNNVSATHYMGGEITWECLSNGRYRFIMKLYRECAGITFSQTEVMGIANYPGISSINMNRISQTDISPVCNPNPSFSHITCPAANISNMGAVEEHVYTSDLAYPGGVQLIGVPPPQGWIFYHSYCCRNPCTNISNAPTLDWFLRAVMYPYNNQNANPCFDNSPTFSERPSTVICTGYPFTYNHNAWDKELDSLTFEWAEPLINANQPVVSYSPGYSYLSPLPGTSQNINNVPATVDPYTGEIAFTSYTQGAFVTVIKVTAYKCGIKVAEIFREMQVVLISCGNNGPPNVTAPFQDPVTGLYTQYVDTVWAGDLVHFTMNSTDLDLLPNGTQQTLGLSASGSQFGSGYTSTTTGCLNPPCATLNPPPPVTSTGGVNTDFIWQTTCSHISSMYGCGSTSNVYNFIIKATDDFCPAPATAWKTITIVVMSPPIHQEPEIRCLAVNPSGDVTLTWAPPDTGSRSTFNSYHIFYSNNQSGPFTEIDSIFNYNTTTYTHLGANANNQPVYYYMKTRSGCSGFEYSGASQTASTIFLNVNSSTTGTANLSWNSIYNPLLPSSSKLYDIYREYPPGNWQLINSTSNLQYIDTITFCNAFINYKVEIYDSSGCTSISNTGGDLFQDITPPAIPTLDSVSIDSITGLSVLGWEQSISSDAQGYIIYQNINGIWTPIDTVNGISNTSYVNNFSIPASGAESYCIAAFDSCTNTSPLGTDHQTIHLTGILDICNDNITLGWTPYIHMDPSLGGYRIWIKENNGALTLLDTVASYVNSYIHSGLNQHSIYCYYIQAFDGLTGKVTSLSNPFCAVANKPIQPQFIYLKVASVEQTSPLQGGRVRIDCYTDTSAYVSKYIFERSTSDTGQFASVGTLPPSLLPFISYTDNSAKVNEKSYFYRVRVIDSCGNTALTSNIGRTIFLDVKANDDFTNTLTWNDYETWLGQVYSYNIYRKINDYQDPFPVNIPFGVNTYVDDVSFFTSEEGEFNYVIEALEGSFNPYGFIDTSYSNIGLALQNPKLFVPNAFSPVGYNNIFKPIGVFIEQSDFLMEIYSRWGQLIYSTSNIHIGWDGKYESEPCPAGVYAYRIRFKNSKGDIIEKHGTVTLIR